MKQTYEVKSFYSGSLELIAVMTGILDDYEKQGYVLTVRQLYYQLVAMAKIENTEKSYKRIVDLVNNAKLAGLMDWDMIEDRTRAFIRRSSWGSASHILDSCAEHFHMDMWDTQPQRLFIIVEKEALSGIFSRVGNELDIPVLAARGYPSGTVLRDFAQRDLMYHARHGQECMILHFGDHDPSGIDMSRDLERRLRMFSEDYGDSFGFQRVALNMDQIQKVKPPKNPAKSTDARFADYRKKFGSSSWELDALNPKFLTDIVTKAWKKVVDQAAWDERKDEIASKKGKLVGVAKSFRKRGL